MRRYIADRGIANSSIAASAATPLIPYLLELVGESLKFLVRERLDIDHAIARRSDGTDDFIQLEMDGSGIAILRILNQKYDQERNNRGRGIHDQLPGVGVMEIRTGR